MPQRRALSCPSDSFTLQTLPFFASFVPFRAFRGPKPELPTSPAPDTDHTRWNLLPSPHV
jgi:hypothetical protein